MNNLFPPWYIVYLEDKTSLDSFCSSTSQRKQESYKSLIQIDMETEQKREENNIL